MTGNYDLVHLIGALLATYVASWIALLALAPIPGIPPFRRFLDGRLRIWLAHAAAFAASCVFLTADMAVEDAVVLNLVAELVWLAGDLRRYRRTFDDPTRRRIDLFRGFLPGTGVPFFALLVLVFGYGYGGESLRWNLAQWRWPDTPAPWERVDAFLVTPDGTTERTGLPDLAACEAWIAEMRTDGGAEFCAAGRDAYGRLPAMEGLPRAYRVVLAR